jgi:hypothetical protein
MDTIRLSTQGHRALIGHFQMATKFHLTRHLEVSIEWANQVKEYMENKASFISLSLARRLSQIRPAAQVAPPMTSEISPSTALIAPPNSTSQIRKTQTSLIIKTIMRTRVLSAKI